MKVRSLSIVLLLSMLFSSFSFAVSSPKPKGAPGVMHVMDDQQESCSSVSCTRIAATVCWGAAAACSFVAAYVSGNHHFATAGCLLGAKTCRSVVSVLETQKRIAVRKTTAKSKKES